ncbi:MAG: (2Fe-2S)-binding protein [Pseudonocardiaceae bacterium]
MRSQRTVESALRLGVDDVADSVSRISGRQEAVEFRFGAQRESPDAPRGWRRCSDLLGDPHRFMSWRKTLAEWLLEQFGEAPDRTTAAYVQSWYLHVPAFVGAMLFHHDRRVPSLRPQHLCFRIAEEDRPHPDGLALTAAEFACLPDDPAAGTPGVTVVGSERALAALLRARYAAHAAQFVRAYGPTVRFGRHTLWAAATDGLDAALWRAGSFGGDEGAGVADAALVLPARLEPFTSASTLHATCDAAGHHTWTRRRESCCFQYLLTDGDGECSTCPRQSPKR